MHMDKILHLLIVKGEGTSASRPLKQCGQCSEQKGRAFNLLRQMFALLAPTLNETAHGKRGFEMD